MNRKLISLLFISAFLGMLVAHAGADYGWKIDKNGILTSVASDLSGKIAIPEEVDDVPVGGLGAGLFAGNKKITSVTIPADVRWIGDDAFRGCTALTEVHFEGLEVPAVGDGIYADCPKVTTIAIAITAGPITVGVKSARTTDGRAVRSGSWMYSTSRPMEAAPCLRPAVPILRARLSN